MSSHHHHTQISRTNSSSRGTVNTPQSPTNTSSSNCQGHKVSSARVAHHHHENLGGVGLVFVEGLEPNRVGIMTVVCGSPAERDGSAAPGDLLYAVGNQEAVGWSLDRVRSEILGPVGSFVTLTLERPTSDSYQRFTVTYERENSSQSGKKVIELNALLKKEQEARIAAESRVQELEQEVERLRETIDAQRKHYESLLSSLHADFEEAKTRSRNKILALENSLASVTEALTREKAKESQAMAEVKLLMSQNRVMKDEYHMVVAHLTETTDKYAQLHKELGLLKAEKRAAENDVKVHRDRWEEGMEVANKSISELQSLLLSREAEKVRIVDELSRKIVDLQTMLENESKMALQAEDANARMSERMVRLQRDNEFLAKDCSSLRAELDSERRLRNELEDEKNCLMATLQTISPDYERTRALLHHSALSSKREEEQYQHDRSLSYASSPYSSIKSSSRLNTSSSHVGCNFQDERPVSTYSSPHASYSSLKSSQSALSSASTLRGGAFSPSPLQSQRMISNYSPQKFQGHFSPIRPTTLFT